MEILDKLASQAYNSITGGLAGITASTNISVEQLVDEIVQTRLYVMQKYALKNQLPVKELYMSINCIPVDCASLDKCCSADTNFSKPELHFEIPQLFLGANDATIQYIGSIDKQVKFKVYTDPKIFRVHKYKIRGASKPFVYIDITPNKNNKLDGYIFNAPLLETLSITAIFKDLRDLEEFTCCDYDLDKINTTSWLDNEVIDTVVKKYFTYYRQYYPTPSPNDQIPK